jgi:hypothetical protein
MPGPSLISDYLTVLSAQLWLGASLRLSLSFGHPGLGRRCRLPAAVSSRHLSSPRGP